MTPDDVILALTAVTAVGALGAAVAAWFSALAIRRAAEGRLFSAKHAEYGSPEMLQALRVLPTPWSLP